MLAPEFGRVIKERGLLAQVQLIMEIMLDYTLYDYNKGDSILFYSILYLGLAKLVFLTYSHIILFVRTQSIRSWFNSTRQTLH